MSQDWARSVCGDVKEQIPENAPEPKGKPVAHTKFFDANLMHCMLTGRSLTGTLDLLNKTPIDWYSKKQGTVETATYSSEFNAGRTATESTMDMRLTLRYLGVPIKGPTITFGDNESMIKSAAYPHSTLKKRHNALSFHRVREALASDMMLLYHVPGAYNPADILSKYWGYQVVWPFLKPLMFHLQDDTSDEEETDPDADGSSDRKGSDRNSHLTATQHHAHSLHFTHEHDWRESWTDNGHG